MLIAQITDLHLTAAGQFAQNNVRTTNRFDQVLSSFEAFGLKLDAILITGDLADNKHPQAYERLAKRWKNLNCPCYLIPGNHDDRSLMRHYFPDHPGFAGDPDDFIQYSIDDFPLRLVALDTTITDSDKGELCSQRLSWLEQTLAQQPDKPTLIFMHHPPFRTGVIQMDHYNLSGIESLEKIIEKNPQVIRIVCGHVHRPVNTCFAGVTTSIAPAVSFTQALNFHPDSESGFFVHSPKYELHWFNQDHIVSHTVSLEAGSRTVPYPEN